MIAKYIRLSDQDDDCRAGETLESNSVVNQRRLLDYYIKSDLELSNAKTVEFCDDGHSGTNFDRPGVQALLERARRGEIECVIVKDLSRFGRNYIEVGDYLEQIFPFLGVRFIAVNDCYDSKTQKYGTAGDLDLGVRNLINELYSRDLSVRVKAARQQYARRGEFIAPFAFFGYVKSAEDKHKLEVDEPAAAVVREIFRLRSEGQCLTEIVCQLNDKSFPTPMIRKQQLGIKRKSWSKSQEANRWDLQMAYRISTDERYTGKLIGLKTMRYEVGNPDVRRIPPEKWMIAENAIPAIISSELFCSVQKPRGKTVPVVKKSREEHPLFYLKIKCGICGMGLKRSRTRPPCYFCNCRISHEGANTGCADVHTDEEKLTEAVQALIRHQLLLLDGAAVEKTHTLGMQEAGTRSFLEQASVLQQAIDRHQSNKKDAFVKRNAGQLTQEEYDAYCAAGNLEITRLKRELAALEESSGRDVRDLEGSRLEAFQGLRKMETLTRDVVDRLIDVIRVFEGGRVEIVWKCRDGYTDLIRERNAI